MKAEDLQQPMQDGVEYFDATTAILELGSRISLLEQALGQQHQLIKMLVAEVKSRTPKSSIIMPGTRELN